MSKPRLLLADDSLTIQKLVNLTFADEGFDVVLVGDGESALREIGAAPPDIVLADVHMPGPDGYEICRLMRSVEETADIPVILLAGSFEPFDSDQASDVGANSFITKPFQSIRSLVEEVNGLLAAKTTEQSIQVQDVGHDEPIADIDSESDVVDTNDIDSLYEQSFAETVEMPAEMANALFNSDKLDDEMIETSYASEPHAEPAESSVTAIYDADFDNGNPTVSPERVSESEEAFEHVYDDLPQATELETEAAFEAEHDETTKEFKHEVRDPFASTADDFDFDEVDLLDLTPANMTETVEFTTPSGAAEQGSRSQVVSLSPELLDIIVQRVVEKLSEKY